MWLNFQPRSRSRGIERVPTDPSALSVSSPTINRGREASVTSRSSADSGSSSRQSFSTASRSFPTPLSQTQTLTAIWSSLPSHSRIDEWKLNSLQKAAYQGNVKKARVILSERQRNINKVDSHHGFTALHVAAEFNQIEIVHLLLDPSSIFSEDKTKDALKRASFALSALKLCNMSVPDVDGRSALTLAVIHSNVEVARILLQHGASPDIPDKIGCTTIHYAVALNNVTCVRLLLENGAKLDVVDNTQLSLLQHAITFECKEIAEILAARGVLVNHKAPGDRTALHMASAKGWMRLVQLLLASGAERNALDSQNRAPIDFLPDDCDGASEIGTLLRSGTLGNRSSRTKTRSHSRRKSEAMSANSTVDSIKSMDHPTNRRKKKTSLARSREATGDTSDLVSMLSDSEAGRSEVSELIGSQKPEPPYHARGDSAGQDEASDAIPRVFPDFNTSTLPPITDDEPVVHNVFDPHPADFQRQADSTDLTSSLAENTGVLEALCFDDETSAGISLGEQNDAIETESMNLVLPRLEASSASALPSTEAHEVQSPIPMTQYDPVSPEMEVSDLSELSDIVSDFSDEENLRRPSQPQTTEVVELELPPLPKKMLEQQQKVKFASSDDLLSRHTLPESISIPSNISSVSDDALSVEQLDAEKQRRESVENASIEAADELKVSTRDLWIDSYKVKNSATAYPQIRRESEPPVSGVSSDERVIIRMLQSENDALKMALELERAQQNELSNSKRLLSATHEENLEKIAELEKINSRLRKAQEESEQDISEKIREAVKSKEREVAAIRERLDVAEEDLAIQTDENAKLNWKCAETKSLYAKSQQECLSLQTQIEQLEKALHSANDSLLEKDLEIQAMQQTTSQTRLELEQQKKEALQREASFAEQAEKRERELTLEASATIQQQKEEMVGKAANMIQTAVAEKEDVIAALNVRIEQVEERLQIHAKEAEQAKIKWNEERNESTAAAAALAEKVRDLEAENEALRNEAEAERVQLTKATEKNENLLLELQNLQRFVTEEETERNRHSNDLQVWEMRFQEMESQKAALRLERDAIDARLHECLAHLEVQSSKFELVREDDAKRHQEEYQRWLSSLEVEKRKIADSERAHESLNRDYSEALNTIKLLEDANRSLKEQLRREAELSKEKSNDIKRLNKTLNSMKQAQVRFDGELQKAQEAEVSSSNAREALERENRTLTKEVTAIQAQFRAFEPQHSELSSNIYLGSPEQIAVDGPTQSDAQQADNSTERSIQQNEPHEQGGLIDFKKDVDALSELQDSHKELEKTCKELTEEIAVRGRQMALQNEQISRLQEEKEVLCAAQSDQQSRFEHDILQLREDCDQYSQQVITLEFELEAAKAALAAALDSLNEVRKLNEELEVRKSEISAFVRTLESEVGSQQKALEEATEQRNVFEEQARNAESALEQRTAEFDQRSNELKGQIDALQSALGIRSADHEAFLLSKSRVSELESALAAKSTEFEELANKADGEKRHLEAALAENRSLVAQLRAEVESLDCWRLQLSAELEDKSAAENLHRAKEKDTIILRLNEEINSQKEALAIAVADKTAALDRIASDAQAHKYAIDTAAKSLEVTRNDLNLKIKQLESILSQKAAELEEASSEANSRLEELESTIAAKQAEMNRMAAETELMAEHLQRYRAESDSLTKQIKIREAAYTALEDELRMKELEVDDVKQQNRAVESMLKEKSAAMDAETKELTSLLNAASTENANLAASLKTTELKHCEMTAELADAKSRLEAASAKNGDLLDKLRRAAEKVELLESALVDKSAEVALLTEEMQAQRRELEARLLSISQSLKDAETAAYALQRMNETLASQNATLAADLDAVSLQHQNILAAQMESAQNSRDVSEDVVRYYEGEIEALARQVEEEKESRIAREAERERVMQELEALEVNLEKLKVELEARREEGEELKGTNERLADEIIALKQHFERRAAAHDELQVAFKLLNEESISKNQKIDGLLQQVHKAESLEESQLQLKQVVEDLQASLREKDKALTEKGKAQVQKEKELSALREEFQHAASEHAQRVVDLTTQVKELEERLRESASEADIRQHQVLKLQQSNVDANKLIMSREQELVSMERELIKLRARNDELDKNRQHASELEVRLESTTADLDRTSLLLGASDAALQTCRTNLRDAESRCSDFASRQVQMELQIAELDGSKKKMSHDLHRVQEELSTLETNLLQSRHERDEMADKNRELDNRARQLLESSNRREQERVEAAKLLSQCQDDLAEERTKLAHTLSQLAEVQRRNSSLENRVNELSASVRHLTSNLHAMQTDRDRVITELTDAQRARDAERVTLESKIAALQASKKDAMDALDKVQNDVDAAAGAKAEHERLRAELSKVKNEAQRLGDELEARTKERESLRSEVAQLRNEWTRLDPGPLLKKIESLEHHLAELRSRHSAEHASLEAQHAAHVDETRRAASAASRRELAELQEQYLSLQRQAAFQKMQHAAEVEGLNGQVAATKRSAEMAFASLAEMQDSVREAHERLAAADKEAHQKVAALIKELGAAKIALGMAESEKDGAEMRLKAATEGWERERTAAERYQKLWVEERENVEDKLRLTAEKDVEVRRTAHTARKEAEEQRNAAERQVHAMKRTIAELREERDALERERQISHQGKERAETLAMQATKDAESVGRQLKDALGKLANLQRANAELAAWKEERQEKILRFEQQIKELKDQLRSAEGTIAEQNERHRLEREVLEGKVRREQQDRELGAEAQLRAEQAAHAATQRLLSEREQQIEAQQKSWEIQLRDAIFACERDAASLRKTQRERRRCTSFQQQEVERVGECNKQPQGQDDYQDSEVIPRLQQRISELERELKTRDRAAKTAYDAKLRKILLRMEAQAREREIVERCREENEAELRYSYEYQLGRLQEQYAAAAPGGRSRLRAVRLSGAGGGASGGGGRGGEGGGGGGAVRGVGAGRGGAGVSIRFSPPPPSFLFQE